MNSAISMGTLDQS